MKCTVSRRVLRATHAANLTCSPRTSTSAACNSSLGQCWEHLNFHCRISIFFVQQLLTAQMAAWLGRIDVSRDCSQASRDCSQVQFLALLLECFYSVVGMCRGTVIYRTEFCVVANRRIRFVRVNKSRSDWLF